MKCAWSAVGALAGLFSGVALGIIIYRWAKGESSPDFLVLLFAFALLLGLISWMSNYLVELS